MDGRAPQPAHGLPSDFLAEVEQELRTARVDALESRHRVAALALLHELTAQVATAQQRPVSVFDVVHAAADPADRARRIRLVGQLRSPRS